MQRVAIIGGETHIGEITSLKGTKVEIVAAAVRPDQVDWAKEQFGCEVVTEVDAVLARDDVDFVAVANENDLKAGVVLAALRSGRDVVVDKPIALRGDEQDEIESVLQADPARRLLMLLTLRGDPLWAGIRDVVQSGQIGDPAFIHVRMAVRLKRAERPPWFLDVDRAGGLFLDLLIHGLDQVEWITGKLIIAVTANMGNLGDPADEKLVDHAAVYCELDDGSSATVEGQRMLPDTKGSDYRVLVTGTQGYADLGMADSRLTVTSPAASDQERTDLPGSASVVEDWLEGGDLIGQEASLRANRLSIIATDAAARQERLLTV